jgi:membrane associated rhomboid family serine protease
MAEEEPGMNRHLARVVSSPAVLTLIGINIAVFVAQLIRNDVADALVLHSGAALTERPWTLVTVFFLHELIVHIAALVLIMLVFGVALEQHVGARHVALIYLAAGLVGSLAIVLTSGALGLAERMVGSSAAFHGIIAAFIALQPDAVVLRSKAKTWLIVLVVANLVLMFPTDLFPTDFTPLSGAGHLAGLAVGFLYGRQLRTTDVAPTGTDSAGGDGRR